MLEDLKAHHAAMASEGTIDLMAMLAQAMVDRDEREDELYKAAHASYKAAYLKAGGSEHQGWDAEFGEEIENLISMTA